MQSPSQHRVATAVAAGVLAVLIGVSAYQLRYVWQGALLLQRLELGRLDPGATRVPVEPVTVTANGAPVVALLYPAAGDRSRGGILLLHGMQYLGMRDPRLEFMARSLAADGWTVLTPQLEGLADYRVDGSGIDAIGASALWLADRLHRPVTVVGFSFAAGMALLAATRSDYGNAMRALVSVGGYDDLARVMRYLATGSEPAPGGGTQTLAPNEYGALIFIYAHADEFFAGPDLAPAQTALAAWIRGDPARARAELTQLSADGRQRMLQLFANDPQVVRGLVLGAIAADAPQLDRLSPHGHLGGLHLAVYLLHGTDDNVIPSPETQWLARDLPAACLRRELITPAMSHVTPDAQAGWLEQWRLVWFFGAVLREAAKG